MSYRLHRLVDELLSGFEGFGLRVCNVGVLHTTYDGDCPLPLLCRGDIGNFVLVGLVYAIECLWLDPKLDNISFWHIVNPLSQHVL